MNEKVSSTSKPLHGSSEMEGTLKKEKETSVEAGTSRKRTSRFKEKPVSRVKLMLPTSHISQGGSMKTVKSNVTPPRIQPQCMPLLSSSSSNLDVNSKTFNESSFMLRKTENTVNFDVGPIDVDALNDGTFFKFDEYVKDNFQEKKDEEITVSNVDASNSKIINFSVINEKEKKGSKSKGKTPKRKKDKTKMKPCSSPNEKSEKKIRKKFGQFALKSKACRLPKKVKKVKKKRKEKEECTEAEESGIDEPVKVKKMKMKKKRKKKEECTETEESDIDEPVKEKKLIEVYSTPQVSDREDIQIKTYFRDLIFYVWYLAVLTTVALAMVKSTMYYFEDITTHLFMDTPNINDTETKSSVNTSWKLKTLRNARTAADVWAFAETTMLKMFYSNFYVTHLHSMDLTGDERIVFFDSHILGVPRMRQVRVRPDSCNIYPDMRRFFNECYDFYSVFSEETRPIKTDMDDSLTPTAWKYTEADELNTSSTWGKISIYGGGGYYIDLAVIKEDTEKMVAELKKNNWLSRATRALFIDFNIYNANVNYFCICKIILEFPPFGGIIPTADFFPLKLIRYLTPLDFFVLGLEFTLIIFAIHFTIDKILTIKRRDFQTVWYCFWTYIDFLIILFLYAGITLGIILYIKVSQLIPTLPTRKYEYTEFDQVKTLQLYFNNVVAFLALVSWIKLFMFIAFNIIQIELQTTLAKSMLGICAFLPIFSLIILAFAITAHLLFGTEVKDYHTIGSSIVSLLQAFTEGFHYSKMREVSPNLAFIFYVCFLLFVILLAMNMMIAIVVEAYADVKSKVIANPPQVGRYLKRGFLNFIGCCCCGLDKKISGKRSGKKKALFEEIKETLRRANFTDMEIKIFFTKYNINMYNVLNEETRTRVLKDLEYPRADLSETVEEMEIRKLNLRLDNLCDDMEKIEAALQPVADKVDILLRRQ